jgi:hypothetical protein
LEAFNCGFFQLENHPDGWATVFESGVRCLENRVGQTFASANNAAKHLFFEASKKPRRSRSFSESSIFGSKETDPMEDGWLLTDLDRIRSRRILLEPRNVGPLEGRISYFEDVGLPDDWVIKSIRSKVGNESKVLFVSTDAKRYFIIFNFTLKKELKTCFCP